MAGARITQLVPGAFPGRRYGSFAGKTGTAVTSAGGYYDDEVPRRKRRVIIDGIAYHVTPSEERELIRLAIERLQARVESAEQKTPPAAKRKAKQAVPAVTVSPVDTRMAALQDRIDVLKVHQQLVAEEAAREALLLEAMRREALQQQTYEDEAIALILAAA